MPSCLFRNHFATLHDPSPFFCHRRHHSMLLLAVLQQWSLYSSFGLIWHISFFLSSLKVSKVRFIYEELKYCVVKTQSICWSTSCEGSTLLWRRSFSTSTVFKSCTLRRHLRSWILDVISLFYFSSLVHSASSQYYHPIQSPLFVTGHPYTNTKKAKYAEQQEYVTVSINLHLCWSGKKGRPGAVVRAVSLSHQVVGSKQPLRRFCGGKAVSVYPFPRPHSCGSLRHWICPFSCLHGRLLLNLHWWIQFSIITSSR